MKTKFPYKLFLIIFSLSIAFSTFSYAQQQAYKGKVYIPPMKHDFHERLIKQIQEQHLPLEVVFMEGLADYVMISPATEHQKIEWYSALNQAQNGGSLALIQKNNSMLLWSYQDKDIKTSKIFNRSMNSLKSNKWAKVMVNKMEDDLYQR